MSKFLKIIIILVIILVIEILLIYKGYVLKKTNTIPIGDKPVFAMLEQKYRIRAE